MIGIVLMLVTAQLVVPDDDCQRTGGRCRGARARENGYAFFEFAPTSGAGMQDVAAHPLPNWAMQSEALGTAPWATTENTTPLVVTNAFTTDPTYGSVTRLQLAATTGSSYTLRYQPFTSGSSFPLFPATITYSLMVKGNAGTSGTVDIMIYRGTGYTRVDCPFTSSWALCSVSATTDGASHAVYIGNATGVLSTAARSAADILVAQVMVNVGSSRSPYIATTTAAKGYTLTGAKSEALTFSRTGVAYATMGTGGGLRTTNISNGDMVLMPGNQPRAEYDSAGTLGLLVESSRTNSILRSQELDNAAWTLDGALTFGSAGTAPDGTTTAELLIDNAATFEGEYQGVTAGAGTYRCSIYMKGDTSTTPLLQIQDVGGTGGLVSSTPTLSTTTWSRIDFGITTAGATTGYRFFIYPQSTAAAQGQVYAWGAQCEAGAYATSYIPTTTAAATRNEEQPTLPFLANATIANQHSWAMTLTSSKSAITDGISLISNPFGFVQPNLNGPVSWGQFGIGMVGQYNCGYLNGSAVGATVTSPIATGADRIACAMTPTSVTAYLNGTSATANGTNTAFTPTVVPLGWSGGVPGGVSTSVRQVDGIVSRFCLDTSSARCR